MHFNDLYYACRITELKWVNIAGLVIEDLDAALQGDTLHSKQ